jgi:hypothetical protein
MFFNSTSTQSSHRRVCSERPENVLLGPAQLYDALRAKGDDISPQTHIDAPGIVFLRVLRGVGAISGQYWRIGHPEPRGPQIGTSVGDMGTSFPAKSLSRPAPRPMVKLLTEEIPKMVTVAVLYVAMVLSEARQVQGLDHRCLRQIVSLYPHPGHPTPCVVPAL